jgi:hypothetical protein
MMTVTKYYELIAEAKRLSRDLNKAEEARNEEAIGKIAFRQMDVEDQLAKYEKALARQGVELLIKEMAA